MRYKVVPEPRDVDFLRSARDALPLVPGSVEDCCTRIRDRTAVPSREEAREVLTFLQALGMAAETERGYHRVRDEFQRDDLAAAFESGVFAAKEILTVLDEADEPLTADAIFEAVRNVVPRWERHQTTEWEQKWTERVQYLLGWGVVFGVVEQVDDGYVRAG